MNPRDVAVGLLVGGGVALLVLAVLYGIVGRRSGNSKLPVLGYFLAGVGILVLVLAALARLAFALR